MAFVEQIVSEANNVNVLLDELKHTSRIRPLRRRELLQRALEASVRGVRVLAQEPLITDSQAYLVELSNRNDANPYKIQEELRQDASRLRWFLDAECDLLGALGVSRVTVEVIRDDLVAILTDYSIVSNDGISPEKLQERVASLLEGLQRDIDKLEDEKRHDATIQRIRGVLEVLGGGLVIVADSAAVPATGPAAPLTAGGAALSIAVGTEAIGRGFNRATG
jgi:hypothetical protein